MVPDGGRVAGLVSLVTGAGSGIGAATAELLAEEGSTVVCCDLDAESCERTAQRIAAAGGSALALVADVADHGSVSQLVGETIGACGRIDILHNNAGISVPGSVHTVSPEDWDRCLAVNLRGTWLVSRAVIPGMLESGGGAIVNTASNFAEVGAPNFAALHAAKGAIRSLTISMARDYAPSIRVNSVSPGVIDTPATRRAASRAADPDAQWQAMIASNRLLRRAGTPREVAYAVLFLASREASFITAHDLVMSGGQGGVAF
jgi:NAD(P)-dependent dehydrogenase (short-subunit alcohol dehydrogenase family)